MLTSLIMKNFFDRKSGSGKLSSFFLLSDSQKNWGPDFSIMAASTESNLLVALFHMEKFIEHQ